ncbi:MAG: PTS sugar transporter subunit IIB [Deltaproteobacteria bacterium]|nr:PTS sugar transporter subunit IIB [Deltaproteobacteria bacterium]
MGIVLCRIDDRLIHGQVVEGWFHYVHPDLVVVADDAAAENAFQCSLMEMVVPYGVRTEVLPVREAVDRCLAGEFSSYRGILLFRHPRDVRKAISCGLPLKEVNLGGLHSMGKTQFLGQGINASQDDLMELQAILDSGIRVEVRTVPAEQSVNLKSLL